MNLLAHSEGYTSPPDPPAGWTGLFFLIGVVALSGCFMVWASAAFFRWVL